MKPRILVMEPRAGAELRLRSIRALPLLALLVTCFMLFARLGGIPLAEPDEGRNAEVAREMMASGAWLVPTLAGLPYLDKPAFFFRSVAVSYSLLGVNEAAARLPSALSSFATLAMLFAFCRRRYGETTASLAVIAAATAPLFFAFSRLVIMDAMLGTFVCASIFAAVLAEEADGRTRRLWYLGSAAAAGFATLVKGPVGFLVPGLVVTVFHLVERRRGALRRCFHPLHLLLFLAVVLPWFVSLGIRQPGFFYYGLVEESFHRFTTGSFNRSEPFWFYLPVVFAGLFPWSLLLPEAAVVAWKRRAGRFSGWSSTDRLFAVWTLVVVVFFSLSRSKQPGYVLTAMVALSALTARLLARALEKPDGRAARIVLRASAAAALIYGVLAAALLVAFSRPELFEHQSKSGRSYTALHGALLPLGVALGLGAAVALAARLRRSPRVAVAALALLPLCLITAGHGALRTYTEARASKRLAARIGSLPARAEVACLQCFPEGLAFYRRQPVTVVAPGGSPEPLKSNYQLFLWERGELRSSHLVDWPRLDAWIAGEDDDGPVLLLGHRPMLGRLRALGAARGLAVSEITPGWWGVLVPAESGR
jgi:4-amino-4-deoxy-L-arabinose transferase-like glycosyltransferase